MYPKDTFSTLDRKAIEQKKKLMLRELEKCADKTAAGEIVERYRKTNPGMDVPRNKEQQQHYSQCLKQFRKQKACFRLQVLLLMYKQIKMFN